MQYVNAPNIILGIVDPLDPNNTKNQVILILKYYLYKCRCLGDKPSINGGLKYLKYNIKIEKTTINLLSSTQREYICKKCMHVICLCICICLCFSLKINKLQKQKLCDRAISIKSWFFSTELGYDGVCITFVCLMVLRATFK